MAAVLPPAYFRCSAKELAPKLLGLMLCRRADSSTVIKWRITETEIYYGEEDTACHASHGRTKRSEVLYHAGGEAYVYRCHMYWLLTLVTGPAEHPEGVLIRGVEGATGPGLTGNAMNITLELHGKPLTPATGLWLEDDGTVFSYTVGTRVGISRAAPDDREKKWRFTVSD
ncbi:MAG: DNA-3-methyladenine glycosylase [Candidatus Methanomethylophilus sp.]|nr:DNA-3-methyladenine glycosylase [Methanomethylophilus sp.]MDD4668452.1 DNA-3-methyladenine glycosylase [Methanomethylophilus sp.]